MLVLSLYSCKFKEFPPPRRRHGPPLSIKSITQRVLGMCVLKPLLSLLVATLLVQAVFARKFALMPQKVLISCVSGVFLPMSLPFLSPINPANAKSELPSLEKCFGAIKKELDPVNGESIQRIKADINSDNW